MVEDLSWDRVCEEESARIRTRRAWLKKREKCSCRFPPNSVGLALSGGGIRSATFSLGLMRSLSEQRLIHCLDYLSTVSGGGYAGAFFCSLYVPDSLRGPAPLPDNEPLETEAQDSSSASPPDDRPPHDAQEGARCDVLGMKKGQDAIALLRQGGHYLAPNGTSDALFAGAIAIRNWFAVAIATGLMLLAFFLFVNSAIAALGSFLESLPVYVEHFGRDEDGRGVWRFVLVTVALWPASCAWAYWFTRSGQVPLSRIARPFSMQSLAAILIILLAWIWPTQREGWHEVLRDSILILAAVSLVVYVIAELVSFHGDWWAGATRKAKNRVEALVQEDRVRNRLSRWLLGGAMFSLAAAAVAVLHWISRESILGNQAVLKYGFDLRVLAGAVVGVAIVIVGVRAVFRTSRAGYPSHLATPQAIQVISLILGVTLLATFVTFWASMAGGASAWIESNTYSAWKNVGGRTPWMYEFAVYWVLKPLNISVGSEESATVLVFVMAVMTSIVAYLIGNVDALLNRSSFSTFYSGRLRSAYLGATNARRHRTRDASAQGGAVEEEYIVPLDRDDPNDEITLTSYYGKAVAAPIHLINVTINETTSRSSRVIQRDRKGKSMTIAPSGYLYPPRSPAEPLAILRRKGAEDLPLSSWMAISGAALTTGAGHHTNLGTAMLATLANVRLGYWWDSRNQSRRWPLRGPRRLVQSYLLRELRASYEGTGASRWYLSDGGHYENTGIYELIRRRIPMIIASDNGADPFYEFADLVNLMRKARIDFGTEIEFLDERELDSVFADSPLKEVFGSLDEIRQAGNRATRAAADPRTRPAKAGPYATLARIRYPRREAHTASVGTLLLIKPRITGRELPDLVQYREANAAFPQQPTTNQFFDEAQWESYFRLGQLIGDMIFKKDRFWREASRSRWHPWTLEPLPAMSGTRRKQVEHTFA